MNHICPICGRPAPYFTDTYDPETGQSACYYLCREHQVQLFNVITDTIMEEAGA